MELDTRTLVVASLMVASLMGTFSLAFATMQGGTRVIGAWGAAMLVLAAGMLGLALRGTIPDIASIALANTLILAGLVLATRGLRIFCGSPTRDVFGWSLTAALLVVLVLCTMVWPNPVERVIAILTAIAVAAARAAMLLRRNTAVQSRLSFRFTEFVLWAVALSTALRVLLTLVAGSGEILEPAPLNSGTFLAYAAFILVATLGVMWMEFQSLQEELIRLATRDPLTGIFNRRAFLEEVEREIARSRRRGETFGLAMFDIDRFKQINDTYGHPVGDRLLKWLVETIGGTLRDYDLMGRYGGEEFVVLMPNSTRESVLAAAERARRAVEQRAFDVNGAAVRVTVSGGVADTGHHGADWDSLLIAADKALYAAKNGGRNRIVAAPASR